MKIYKYQKVYNAIKERIDDGEYLPNHRIPTEAELMQEFQIAKMTVRQAIDQLERDHLIYRLQGDGTYVMPKDQLKMNRVKKANDVVLIPWQTNTESYETIQEYLKVHDLTYFTFMEQLVALIQHGYILPKVEEVNNASKSKEKDKKGV